MLNAMDRNNMAGTVGIGILLGILSIQDLKKKQVSLLFVWGMFGVGIMCHILRAKTVAEPVLAAALLGGIMGIVVFLSKHTIGAGDAWTIAALGGYLGLWSTLTVLFYGSLFCAAVGGVLLVCRKGTKKMQLPFLPFLFLGYCMYIFVEPGGIL